MTERIDSNTILNRAFNGVDFVTREDSKRSVGTITLEAGSGIIIKKI